MPDSCSSRVDPSTATDEGADRFYGRWSSFVQVRPWGCLPMAAPACLCWLVLAPANRAAVSLAAGVSTQDAQLAAVRCVALCRPALSWQCSVWGLRLTTPPHPARRCAHSRSWLTTAPQASCWAPSRRQALPCSASGCALPRPQLLPTGCMLLSGLHAPSPPDALRCRCCRCCAGCACCRGCASCCLHHCATLLRPHLTQPALPCPALRPDVRLLPAPQDNPESTPRQAGAAGRGQAGAAGAARAVHDGW